MRQAGLPAPNHQAVNDEDSAVRAAEALGYPVVVKPSDKDGGVGVSVGLKTPEAVRKAFRRAREYSRAILVESFIEGRDYRLITLNGQLIWAVERVPGGVTGDGKSTIRQLVDQLNADPLRTDGPGGKLRPLLFDEEAAELLAERGMDETTIPTAGARIALRGAANVASGGTPVDVFDQVHIDNRQLAERAARAFRLDVAGIDLLIPDISRSWKETGAGICEINAQPCFGRATAGHLAGSDPRERGGGQWAHSHCIGGGRAGRFQSALAHRPDCRGGGRPGRHRLAPGCLD